MAGKAALPPAPALAAVSVIAAPATAAAAAPATPAPPAPAKSKVKTPVSASRPPVPNQGAAPAAAPPAKKAGAAAVRAPPAPPVKQPPVKQPLPPAPANPKTRGRTVVNQDGMCFIAQIAEDLPGNERPFQTNNPKHWTKFLAKIQEELGRSKPFVGKALCA
jgi:hypothetical protein